MTVEADHNETLSRSVTYAGLIVVIVLIAAKRSSLIA